MDSSDDIELLRQYVARQSEDAFGQVVARHVNMVYSVALRHVGNPDQAQEITQAVFVVLARRAPSLRSGTVVSGWLFQAARLTASNFLRNELRRARREHEAYMQSTLLEKSDDPWYQIAPLLDPAIASLGTKDRNAIVLRYVEGKDLKEVGARLGASEEAAKKRIGRAVEKLRKFFSKRGVVLSGAVMASAISANSVQAAPVGLAATATGAAASGTALAASTITLAKGTLKVMAWTKLNVAAGVCVFALLACQWRENVVQGREIAQAQAQLQKSTQALAVQESTAKMLEQQNQAIVAGQRELELAPEKLQERLAAAAAAAKSATGLTKAGRPEGMVAKMMRDPILRENERRQLATDAKGRYALFFDQLKLPPDQVEKFGQIWSENGMKNLDAVAAMDSGEMTKAEAIKIEADDEKEMDRQINELLGEPGAEQYRIFSDGIPGRNMINQWQIQLSAHPLSEEQRSQLLAIIVAEPYDVTSGIVGDYDVKDFATEADLEGRFQRQADVNQRILKKAVAFLGPEQLDAVGTWQTNNMLRQRATAVKLVGKF